MTTRFSANDYSPAARLIMGEATRAGVTRESFGQWMNLAIRYQRLGKAQDAADCALRAIAVHEVWGARHAVYAVSDATLARARAIAGGEG